MRDKIALFARELVLFILFYLQGNLISAR